MWFIVLLFIVIVGGCWAIFRWLGQVLFPDRDPSNCGGYVDKSVHHHYHDNRTLHVDKETFKSLKDKP